MLFSEGKYYRASNRIATGDRPVSIKRNEKGRAKNKKGTKNIKRVSIFENEETNESLREKEAAQREGMLRCTEKHTVNLRCD